MPDQQALRSLLFVPGDRPDMIAKVGRAAPDGVVIDLEDAVSTASKEFARLAAMDALAELTVPDGTLILVRVNVAGSPWHADDVAAAAGSRADGVVLPKTETAAQLGELRNSLDTAGRPDAVIVAGVETATGVADARPLLAAAAATGTIATYFGAEDYIADVGGRRTAEGSEVLYARSHMALAARLGGVPALDQVVVAVHDDRAFLSDAEQGMSLGYQGKLCIHPAQVPLANRVFAPSEDEIAHARAVLDAVAAADGAGVVLVDGQMVDEVHLRMARAVLARAGRRG